MSAPELVAGYVVGGKYAVRSLLLNGGAMATYRAMGAKNREVAVKLYDPAILSFPDVLKALAQHQSIGHKVSSHQVVPITESGTDANSGAPYTVTDFEQGPSIARLVDRGPLSAAQMVALTHNLAAVIDMLHANGIASLSLHPANVFVRPGAQYEVRVADFGASLVRTALPSPEKAGRWMPWLAPEQIKAQSPATHASDVFALALLAFFAVTGKPYWRSSQKTPDPAALRREILGERMPASVRASEFSVTLNGAVDTVFARALAFKPAERFATAREFAVALDAAISGRPVAEIEAARKSSADLASANLKAGPAPGHASSPGEAVPQGQRMAPPPPRKMPLRSTMLGVGAQPEEAGASPGAQAGPRPKLNTMLGMGEAAAQAVAAATAAAPKPAASAAGPSPAKISAPETATLPAKVPPPTKPSVATVMMTTPAKAGPPEMPAPPVKASPPAMPMAQAKAAPPPMPIAPIRAAPPPMPMPQASAPARAPEPRVTAAMPAIAVPSAASPPAMPATSMAQGAPPPLPMVAPPPQMEEVLARFEAAAPDLSPRPAAASPARASPAADSPAFASPIASDVMQGLPTWAATGNGDATAERVETGVAVIGTDVADKPKSSRMWWIAGASALLVLTAGGAWALTGSSSPPHGAAASDAKSTATAAAIADQPAPLPTEPPAADPPAAANVAQPSAEEARRAAPPDPVATAAAPVAQEPQAAEPAAPAVPPPSPPAVPIADNDTPAQPAIAPSRSAPLPPNAGGQIGSAVPRPAQPKKPCGKFLKRCK